MKDNLDIEELFKEKFSSFEGEVSPNAWTNIQQGMNAAGAAGTGAATGMSLLMKTIIISGGIIAATVVGVYFFSDGDSVENAENPVITLNETETPENQIVDQNESNELTNTLNEEEGLNSFENEVNENNSAEETAENNLVEENGMDGSSSETSTVETGDQSTETNSYSSEENTVSNTLESNTESGNQGNTVEDAQENTEDVNQNNDLVEKLPSGTLTFEAGDRFAPSTYSFEAKNLSNHATIKWEFGDGETAEGAKVKHTFTKPGEYDVKMTITGSDKDYTDTETIRIQSKSSIGKLPNIITPNGDHINDFAAISTTEIETFFITIRDANGKSVYESTDSNFMWGGTDQGGNQLDEGRYTFMIFAKGTDGNEFKIPGQIYIQR